jgi:FkbM family methyltransferase
MKLTKKIKYSHNLIHWLYAKIVRPLKNWGKVDKIFKPLEMEFILEHLKKDDIYFDIGASRGCYSLPVAKKGIKVHAFEPIPKTFKQLKENIRIQKLESFIVPNCLAVSDKNGYAKMSDYLDTANHLIQYSSTNKGSFQAATTTLDSYVRALEAPKVDFIKCDIEGAEFLMLKGAVETIRRHKPKLLLEVDPRWTKRFDYEPKDIFDILTRWGYKHKEISKTNYYFYNPEKNKGKSF